MAMLLVATGVGCGRLGFELLPVVGYSNTADAGEHPLVNRDASTGGAGMDAGSPDDAGDDAAGPVGDAGDAATCATLCENDHGRATCDTGTCELECALGYADCDGDPGNGCEADIATTDLSCGSCEITCANENGQTDCDVGLCSPICSTGYADCDTDPVNGCEQPVDTTMDCGGCGLACSNTDGTTTCLAGACVPVCDSGYADCDGNPDNGCETDTINDPAHCGSCPNACGTNGQICTAGVCEASPCGAGLAECDGDLAVTCETDITTSLNHCGFCTNTCTTDNGTPECTASACAIQGCDGGFDNCDNDVGTGCETPLATTTAHCGGCGAACTNDHGNTSCSGSTCVPSCSAGYDDCDNSRRNGCETALDGIDDCGMCGVTCPANGGTPVCSAGVCDTTCDFSGTYALKLSLAGSWPATVYVRSGSGTFRFWMKVQATHTGSDLDVTVTECGRYFPPFASAVIADTFLYGHRDSLFDNDYLPASTETATLGDSSPDAILTWPLTATQLGISMSNPKTDPWPNSASGVPSGDRVDMDGDGKAGVTATYANGGGYIYPRTSAAVIGFNRAELSYVASRLTFSLNGAFTSCTSSTGSASFNHLDTRIFGCKRGGSSQDCNSSERDFLDTYAPLYNLGSASYALEKVSAGAGCSTVRATLP